MKFDYVILAVQSPQRLAEERIFLFRNDSRQAGMTVELPYQKHEKQISGQAEMTKRRRTLLIINPVQLRPSVIKEIVQRVQMLISRVPGSISNHQDLFIFRCFYQHFSFRGNDQALPNELSDSLLFCFPPRFCLRSRQTPCFRGIWSAWTEDNRAKPGSRDEQ